MPARPAPYWHGSWPAKHSAPSGATFFLTAIIAVEPVAGTDQIVHMIKNIAIIGGLINFVAS